jgi:putative hydrolase of the HAD superfamily
MHYCGSAAERCVYIGDNPAKDFYGARRLGWFTVQVRRPDGIYEAGEPVQRDYAPDAVIETLYPVAEVI